MSNNVQVGDQSGDVCRTDASFCAYAVGHGPYRFDGFPATSAFGGTEPGGLLGSHTSEPAISVTDYVIDWPQMTQAITHRLGQFGS